MIIEVRAMCSLPKSYWRFNPDRQSHDITICDIKFQLPISLNRDWEATYSPLRGTTMSTPDPLAYSPMSA